MSTPEGPLTAKQAAARIGVSTRTLSRYVDAGLIAPSHRTRGGHRRFAAADIDGLKTYLALEQPPATPTD